MLPDPTTATAQGGHRWLRYTARAEVCPAPI